MNLYIFDLHETLIQGNEDAMYEIMCQIFDERKIDFHINKQEIKKMMIFPLETIFKKFLPKKIEIDIPQMVKRFRELSPTISPKYLKPIEGVIEILSKIKEKGHFITIVTTTNEKIANKMIEWTNLSNFVTELKGSGVGDPIEYKANCILELIKKYPSEKVYMIGDRNEDVKAGKKAGVITILYSPDFERNREADFVIRGYDEFSTFL